MPYQPPIEVKPSEFGKDEFEELRLFVKEKVEDLDRRLQSFRNDKLPEYVRLYKGRPKQKEADWPWPGAANLVIQLIGTYSDELLARVLGSIFMYDPLWSIVLSGDSPDEDGEQQKQVFEKFMADMAYEPKELDLYRIESAAYHSAIKYGTGLVYNPYEFQEEIQMMYAGGGEDSTSDPTGKKKKIVVRDGPHPELLPLNRILFEPNSPTLDGMKFYGFIESLDYWDIQNLQSKSPYYKKEDIDLLLGQPDAVQETEMEREINAQFDFGTAGISNGAARWYIYNVFFKYTKGGDTYSMMAKYSKSRDKLLYVVYNNYPKNQNPLLDVKLAYDDESYLGTGFAEMLHTYQKELSNNSNWRTNNRNYAMMGVWRVSPESKLSSILEFYPGVALPAKDGEVELLKPGADVGYSNEPDMFIMSCAKERAGVDPATGGTGGGIVNPKRGIYSAAGTSMVLTQQNNRNNLRTADMRSMHVRLGIQSADYYAYFGAGARLKKYGSNAEVLRKALKNYEQGNLGFRFRPTSAALNKELDRQNDVMLSDKVERFYQTQAQMLEVLSNPQVPPPMKEYYTQALVGGSILMEALLRNFNKENTSSLIPNVKKLIQAMSQGAGNGGKPSAGSGGLVGPQTVPSSIIQGGSPSVPTSA